MSALSSLFHRAALPPRRALLIGVIPLALLAMFFVGYWPRHSAQQRLTEETRVARQELPKVVVVPAIAAEGARPLVLPGALSPSQQTLINARANGYVRRWKVDIGDRVRVGDVLAELETPELDQQLDQARAGLSQKGAALQQAVANLDYAQVTATRQDALLRESVTTQQADDQAHAQVNIWEANVAAAQADVVAAQATVRELLQLVSFGRVVAPFDGRITQRRVDVGSLVTAGGTAGSSPLFAIEATDPIRVFVEVPQAYALSIQMGQPATLLVRQLPGRVFEGQVTRTAGTLDPSSRTLNVEIDVPNPKGELLGGMFAEATISVALAHRIVRVPSGAVIDDASGVRVATVRPGGVVHLVTVVRGVDNGRDVDIVSGLEGGEQVIASPGGDATDGMRVEATKPP